MQFSFSGFGVGHVHRDFKLVQPELNISRNIDYIGILNIYILLKLLVDHKYYDLFDSVKF